MAYLCVDRWVLNIHRERLNVDLTPDQRAPVKRAIERGCSATRKRLYTESTRLKRPGGDVAQVAVRRSHRRAVLWGIVLLGAAATLVAQAPPQRTPLRDSGQPSQRGTAVIRGRIVAADSGRPLRRAEIMSRSSGNVGAVAFSRTGDPMMGEFNDARLLQKFGNVPDDLGGL